jgi:hypothetical protein
MRIGEDEYEHEGYQGRILADNGRRRVQSGEDVIGELVALSELEADDEAESEGLAGIRGEQARGECHMAFRPRERKRDGRWTKRGCALSKVSQGHEWGN